MAIFRGLWYNIPNVFITSIGVIMAAVKYHAFPTVIGKMTVAEEDGFLVSLDFKEISAPSGGVCEITPLLKRAEEEITEYLGGSRTVFDLPLNPKGTPFMLSVWEKLKEIPYGKTASYSDIAEAIGKGKARRAVGLANNRNPLPIFIPCHRVIGKSGKLVGYGGGLPIKEFLLNLEKKPL